MRRCLAVLSIALCFASPQGLLAQGLRYDREWPALEYSSRSPTDPLTRLIESVSAGAVQLEASSEQGYLPSLLNALGVSASSQTLVFSGTSLLERSIRPATPRAVYFADEVYAAWIQGSDEIELAAYDPWLGPVFYTLSEGPDGEPSFERMEGLCLQCHDSFGLSGGGVPRLLTGSGVTDLAGNIVTHDGWIVTDHKTPIERRWGGWYVTGTHGRARHLGNLFVENPAEIATIDPDDGANKTDLAEFLDTSPYLEPTSDIVALLVLEHQITVQNAMVRAGWETRSLLYPGPVEPSGLDEALRSANEPLLEAMLLVGEAAIEAPIEGTSGFHEAFSSVGPRDPRGRSFRDLDLSRRLFRYPLSYLIHSDGFRGLPRETRLYVYRRLADILTNADESPTYDHLTATDRTNILQILETTVPEFLEFRER